METLKILITVKTYPIPSQKYDELVCTAGVTEQGDFVRLYPINFRDLDYERKYTKYQWIEVQAQKHTGGDSRRESYRPDCETIKVLGDPIPTKNGDWSERAKYVLRNKAQSMEDLSDRQESDKTSLGIFKPRKVLDLIVTPDSPEWKPRFKAELNQARLWENRTNSSEPPRKVPFKFQYKFECDDPRCSKKHRMMIEDWEVGALFWRMVDGGCTHEAAADKVRQRFLTEICGPDKDTYFYVGTISAHPKSWIVIGTFYPKKPKPGCMVTRELFPAG
ncbi:MAG: hypothetical protein IMZ62_17765 [Chloroflexi bacterium]|nr:hypothetical protein [Chloroflexota bacterium]